MKKMFGLVFLFFFSMSLVSFAEFEKAEYIIGVAPQYTVVATYESWMPFIDYLAKEKGLKAKLKLSKSMPEFEKELLNGVFDFAFMSPYHQVQTKKVPGYIPLVYDDSNKLFGILVVNKDDPIKSVKELEGQKIAFPSLTAIAGSVLLRAALSDQGISFKPEYVKTHDNVYRNVILGKARAGGGVRGTFKKQPPEVRNELRVLFESNGITSHPFSAHPRVPEEVRQDVTAALLNLPKTPEGQTILDNIQLPKPAEADYEKDYKILESMNIEKYFVKDLQ